MFRYVAMACCYLDKLLLLKQVQTTKSAVDVGEIWSEDVE